MSELLVLRSASAEYEVLDLLGSGMFGKVFKCSKRGTSNIFAIKMTERYPHHNVQNEFFILSRLKGEDADEFNFVRAYEYFTTERYECFVFEMLNQSLFDYMEENNFVPLPLCHIRPILQQISSALLKFSELGIIHCDLKSANIMLVNHPTQPFRIKIIDFGLATDTGEPVYKTYVQSRFYRAPEVILGIPFCKAIDMWSLGCIAAELFLGHTLYPGSSEFYQIKYIVETQGLPSQLMLKCGTKTSKFFSRENGFWRLKTTQEYEGETKSKSNETSCINIFNCLDVTKDFNTSADVPLCKFVVEKFDRGEFIDLLKRMLNIEPATRLTPREALNHNFINLTHLEDYYNCNKVKEYVKIMEVCRRENGHCKVKKSFSSHQQRHNHLQRPLTPCPISYNCDCMKTVL